MAKVHWTGRTRSFRSTPQRKITFAVGLLMALLGVFCYTIAPNASAAGSGSTPITSYSDYPQASLLPQGCSSNGSNILTNVHYTYTRGGVTTPLTRIDLTVFQVGDSLTMLWDGYADADCNGALITLAVKNAPHNTFVLTDDQTLFDWVSCGGTGTACAGSLTLRIPDPQDACNFQIDAVVGPPLQDVGPSGSYYSQGTRDLFNSTFPDSPNPKASGPDMLIGFSNGGRGSCAFPNATYEVSCTSVQSGPGAVLTITNPDVGNDTTVDVKKDGNLVTGGNDVPVLKNGGTATVDVPIAEGGSASVDVIDNSNGKSIVGWPKTIAGPTGCTEETTTTTVHRTTTTTSTTTSTTQPCETTTTQPGETTTTVAGSSSTTTPEQCSTTTTAQVEGSTTVQTVPDTVQGEELARTGSNSTSAMTAYAGLLLVAGGLLMALANRPVPASATTRSRGR